MARISLLINIVLFIAVCALFYLHFAGEEHDKAETSVQKMEDRPEVLRGIAYVNSDSLLKKYRYFQDISLDFQEKAQKLQQEYANRARRLQSEIQRFQQIAPTMGMAQRQSKEQSLMQEQQQLMQYEQELSQQLMREESDLNEKLYDKVSVYLKDYGQKNNLSLILTYTKGSGVLYASDSLNITSTVIRELNEAYSPEKK